MLKYKFTSLNNTIITNKDLTIHPEVARLMLAATEFTDGKKGVDQPFNIGIHI